MEFIKENLLPLLELITLIIQLYLFFKPSDENVIIHQGDRYYFNTTYSQNTYYNTSTTDNSSETIAGLIVIFISYIFYSLLQKHIITIVIVLSLIKILKYRLLKISTRAELFLPIILSLAFYSMNYLPNNVKLFWATNSKVDIAKLTGLSTLLNTLAAPLKELVELVWNWNEHFIRNISILGTVLFVLFALYYLIKGIFTSKQNIRVTTRQDIQFQLIPFIIVYGLIFYHIEWNPIRIVIEAVRHFLNH